MINKTKWRYYIIALVPSFMGAASYILSKYIINDISPIALLFYRWFVALIVLTPFAITKFIAEIAVIRANLKILSIIAISGVTLFNLFTYCAMQYTSSTNTSIIVSIFPIFVLSLGVFINKDKLNKIQLCSIILSFFGAVVIVSHGRILEGVSYLFHNTGDFIALSGALCWAIYVFAVKSKPSNLSFLSFLYSTLFIGVIFIVPLYLLDVFYLGHQLEINALNIGIILFLGVGVSIVGLMIRNHTAVAFIKFHLCSQTLISKAF